MSVERYWSFVFLCWVLCVPVLAKPMPNVYTAELLKVIDADTIKLRLELYPGLYKDVNLRVSGIDTPESRRGMKSGVRIEECEVSLGKSATRNAIALLEASKTLLVINIDPQKTKYSGRINGELLFDGQDYGSYMIKQGLAVKYEGGRRSGWDCG